MEIFKCKHCGNIIYLENTSCAKFGYHLGFETEELKLCMSFAMNSINRSMGHIDLYPFVITPEVMEKLSFIHEVCYQSRV